MLRKALRLLNELHENAIMCQLKLAKDQEQNKVTGAKWEKWAL